MLRLDPDCGNGIDGALLPMVSLDAALLDKASGSDQSPAGG